MSSNHTINALGKRKRGNDLFCNEKRRKVASSPSPSPSPSSRSPSPSSRSHLPSVPTLSPPASPTPPSYVACLPPPTSPDRLHFSIGRCSDDEDFSTMRRWVEGD
ncbi:hypothetical protein BD770DRAFT_447343 [Pilaira anomala]|nr:hypothetical protein BD770DRAFT_447343 [Pilaira anomala]